LPIGTEVHRHSIFEYVLRTRRPIVINAENAFPSDVSSEPFESSSLMALPLIWGDVVPGVILMAGREGNRTFTRDERMLVSFVADVTAMTVSGFDDRRALEGVYLGTMATLMEAGFDDRRALEGVYLGTMATLMEAVEAKDIYTRGHTDRVTELATAFAESLGIKGDQLETIKRAAALHDIGKIALPDKIMLKPGPLDSEERATVQEHSARAEKMLQHLSFLDSVRMIVRSHHERYDGTGYPDGLEGEEIPLGARILTIVDAYDAMTSVRPYRGARGHEDALGEIAANAGKQFDPTLAAAFLEMMEKRQRDRSLALSDADLVTHDRS
jgi:putative nucleotidyltransferase with HDIG domain